MASKKEVQEALLEYQKLSNSNQKLIKMNRDWTKVIHLYAQDLNEYFTMQVVQGKIIDVSLGQSQVPDIIILSSSEIFCDMFWGDLNPTQKYLTGELQVKGTQEDIMRLDAISAIIWPE